MTSIINRIYNCKTVFLHMLHALFWKFSRHIQFLLKFKVTQVNNNKDFRFKRLCRFPEYDSTRKIFCTFYENERICAWCEGEWVDVIIAGVRLRSDPDTFFFVSLCQVKSDLTILLLKKCFNIVFVDLKSNLSLLSNKKHNLKKCLSLKKMFTITYFPAERRTNLLHSLPPSVVVRASKALNPGMNNKVGQRKNYSPA